MVVQIYTYDHVNDLLYNPDFSKELSSALHITATSSLKRGIMNSISSGNRWITAPILSFGQLVPFIGDEWFSSKTELLQYTSLSKSMRKFASNYNNYYNERIFQAIDKNQKAVLRTIRTLIDSGIRLSDAIRSLSDIVSQEEKVIFNLWGDLEQTDSFINYNAWLNEFEQQPIKKFRTVVEQALRMAIIKEENRANTNILPNVGFDIQVKQILNQAFNPKKGLIVFHGFYFVTPVQKRILEQLAKDNHLRIVYLIQYNDQYKETFKTVETFLEFDKYGYTPIPKKNFPVNYLAKKFAHMIEGDVEEGVDSQQEVSFENGNLREFNHMYQFKNYIQHYPDEIIVSPRASTVRKYTEDLVSPGEANLKDYPIGQFLIDIHSLNKRTFKPEEAKFEEKEQIEYNLLLKIFNSGYLMIGNESAKSYLLELQKIKPVMQNCQTLEGWLDTLQWLITQKQSVEKKLERPNFKAGIEHELYSYPNRFLSYFNVTTEDLEKIKEGIYEIKVLYDKLYIGSGTSIADYIRELQGYMDKNIRAKKAGEEQRIVKKVIEQLDSLKDEEFSGIERSDLILGLKYFLASSPEQESDLGEQVDNGIPGTSDPILSLQDADKLPFLQNRYVHLAFMDNKSLPLSQNLSLWPFKRQSIERFEKIDQYGSYLKQINLRKDLSASITSYLIYVVLQRATKAKFSVVKNFEDEHNLTTSFYIKLLDLTKGSTDLDLTQNEINRQYNSEHSLKELNFRNRANTKLLEFTNDYCRKRFVMSFLLQERVDFSSDFHYTFLYRGYLQLYYHLLKSKKVNNSDENVNSLIDSCFPQWNPLKKEMLRQNAVNYFTSTIGKRHILKKVKYDGVEYMDHYKRVTLFGNKVTPSDNFANSGIHCKYCTFQLYCKESRMVSDN